jgi:hypothetical protein
MKIYRTYDTGESWTFWALSHDGAMLYLRDEQNTGELRQQSSSVYGKFSALYYTSEAGREYCIDELDIDTTPEGLVKFLNGFAGE